ncbi:MAG: P-loop NTPase [Pseudonocardiaceae bacterium]|nr:P-loop NTPase [Pseudonocardiaceae bacterium]
MILGRKADVRRIRAAVAAVRDPEIDGSLDELGMLGDIRVSHSGTADVEILLTTESCPMRGELEARVRAALAEVSDVDSVHVRFGVMAEHQRMRVASGLRKGIQPGGPLDGPGPRVYAVASGKGGVGKSSVTANLAVAMALDGLRVGVLDADVWGYSIPRLFGVRRSPVAMHGVMLPVRAHGVALMSVGFLVPDEEPVVWRGPMLHKAIEQFVGDVHWDGLDVLLLDLPPGTGDVTLSVLELLPDAALLVVTTPQPMATSVASRVGKMARDSQMPVAGVVENMSAALCAHCGEESALFGSGGGEELAARLEAPLLGAVPLDVALREAGDAGVPAVLRAPASRSAAELRRIAGGLPRVQRGLAGRSLPLAVV